MQLILKITCLTSLLFSLNISLAQDIIPKAKTKAERKAERKSMTLEERIEDVLPIDIGLPSASANLPGGKKITSVEEAKKYVNETVSGVSSKSKQIRAEIKKKKKAFDEAKAKVFDGKKYEGIGVEKQIYKRGTGSRMKYMEFYTLEDFQAPDVYAKSVFWYDLRRRRIVEAISRDPRNNKLMHGPYKEYLGETLVKEGFYYLGTLDGRWETYDKEFILLDKEYYNRGFYKDSEISYFDGGKEKIKEVVPMIYGKKTGEYFRFYKNGILAEEGQYDDGAKVGGWIEYYDSGNRRRKEIQYPHDVYDKAEPILLREFSSDGKMIFEHESVKRL
ncbi:MAG: antitoxin component YwqK of YwqJK toxin-antitoxin module [Arcticibacterium sp.]|jgi:antitoxin component YwqK of YwqJK toxin-antitoxin module